MIIDGENVCCPSCGRLYSHWDSCPLPKLFNRIAKLLAQGYTIIEKINARLDKLGK